MKNVTPYKFCPYQSVKYCDEICRWLWEGSEWRSDRSWEWKTLNVLNTVTRTVRGSYVVQDGLVGQPLTPLNIRSHTPLVFSFVFPFGDSSCRFLSKGSGKTLWAPVGIVYRTTERGRLRVRYQCCPWLLGSPVRKRVLDSTPSGRKSSVGLWSPPCTLLWVTGPKLIGKVLNTTLNDNL